MKPTYQPRVEAALQQRHPGQPAAVRHTAAFFLCAWYPLEEVRRMSTDTWRAVVHEALTHAQRIEAWKDHVGISQENAS